MSVIYWKENCLKLSSRGVYDNRYFKSLHIYKDFLNVHSLMKERNAIA